MRDNISPEEKLLRLIRGPKQKQAEVLPSAKKPDAQSVQAPELKASAKEYAYHSAQPASRRFNMHKLALASFIISCLYLGLSFFYPWFGTGKMSQSEIAKEEDAALKAADMPEVRPYEYYSEPLKDRQIFSSPASQGQERQTVLPVVGADSIKDINLIGIISGENPQAIIEDKKTQKTYYVKKGESMGAFQVEEIQEGKVTLSYMSEKFDLYL